MNKRGNKKLFIIVLIILISIGFSLLQTTLNINGIVNVRKQTWDIYFDNIQVNPGSVELQPTDTYPTISQDKLTIDFLVSMRIPGEYYEFDVDVVNDGSLDAMIKTVINANLSNEQKKRLNFTITYKNGDPLEEKYALLHNSSKTYTVRLEYRKDIDNSDLSNSVISIPLSFSCTYEQADSTVLKTATFKTGLEVCQKMIELSNSVIVNNSLSYNYSNNITPKPLGYLNNSNDVTRLSTDGHAKIKAFKRASVLADGLSSSNIISISDSDLPIYMWFEIDPEDENNFGTIYWYSDANVVFLNEDSSNFFAYFILSDTQEISCIFSFLTDLSGVTTFNTSRVKDMSYMFAGCLALTDLDFLEDWNVRNVENMTYIFAECSGLTDIDGLQYWRTNSLVDMSFSFAACAGLTSLQALSSWDVSMVEDLGSTFTYCYSLTNVNALSGWQTDSLLDMGSLFLGCSALNNINGLSSWNVHKVKSMRGTFASCSQLTSVNALSGWTVNDVEDMSEMFIYCSSLTDATALSSWNVDTDIVFVYNMFYNSGVSNNVPSWYPMD